MKRFIIMQRTFLLAIALACGLGVALLPTPSFAGPESYVYGALARLKLYPAPKQMPDVDFLDASGRPVKLSAFKGKATIVVLWATWCGFCISDLPSLSALQNKLGKDKLQILNISVDSKGYYFAKKFMDDNGYGNLDVYSDPESMVGTGLGARGIPYAFFYDRDGLEIGRLPGATNWMAEEMLSFINYYISAN